MKRWTFADVEKLFEAMVSPEPLDARKAARRRRILDVASDAILRHGYRRASIDDIARRSGVAKGTVYLYFESKADLLMQILLEERRHKLALIKEVLERKGSGLQRLELWLEGLLKSIDGEPITARLLSGDREIRFVLEELDSDYLQQVMSIKVDFLAALIEDAAGAGALSEDELRARARTLIAVFQSAGMFAEPESRLGVSLDEFASQIARVLAVGAVAPPVSEPVSWTTVGR